MSVNIGEIFRLSEKINSVLLPVYNFPTQRMDEHHNGLWGLCIDFLLDEGVLYHGKVVNQLHRSKFFEPRLRVVFLC